MGIILLMTFSIGRGSSPEFLNRT